MQRSAAAVSKFKIIFAWPSTSVACTIREIRIARAYRDHGTGNEKIAVLVAEGYCALIGYGSSAAAASIFLERGRGGGGGTEVPRRQLGPVPPSSCFPPRLANTHSNSPCLASLRPSLPSLTVNLQITCKIQIGPALSTRRRIRGTLLPVPDVSRLSIFLKIDAKITRKESKENLSRWRIKHDYASLVTIVSTASGVSVAATPARAK